MTFLFRADGNAAIGLGHVMRCLALAQAARQAGHASVFVLAADGEKVFDRLRAEGCTVVSLSSRPGSREDANATVRSARAHGADWIIVDGYQFSHAYQSTVRRGGMRLLVIDDYGHAERYDADILLNQNVYAEEMAYRKTAPNAQLLLGPTYALLRQEFLRCKNRERTIAKTVRKILVSMGGADAANDTGRVIRCLEQIDQEQREITIVSGAANPHLKVLRQDAEASRHAVTLLANVENMPALMMQADLAITAGGSTCYELLYMGLPGVVFITADNQERNVHALQEVGAIVSAGWNTRANDASIIALLASVMSDSTLLQSLHAKGLGIVDGCGCSRVLSAMQHPRT